MPLFFLMNDAQGQTFLKAYSKDRQELANKISNSKTRKKIKNFVKNQIVELDTIFKSYYARTNFDFNTADSIFLIFDTPEESMFFSSVIIWSGKDTIEYKQGFELIKPSRYKRIITYEPYLLKKENDKGIKVVTERDSIVNLVAKRDFETLNSLGENQNINDGSYLNIYVAYKRNGQYVIEHSFPKKFMILDTHTTEPLK